MSYDFRTRISEDLRRTNILNDFLDHEFYGKHNFPYTRVYDKETQVQGVDIKFSVGDKTYICDEKSATSYMGKELNTFCLELFQKTKSYNSVGMDGWFLSDKNINDSYLFVWVDELYTNENIKSYKDIKKAEVCLVRKERLLKYLSNYGFNKDYLKTLSRDMFAKGTEEVYIGKGTVSTKGLKVKQNLNMSENPINLLLSRNVYRRLADINEVINC